MADENEAINNLFQLQTSDYRPAAYGVMVDPLNSMGLPPFNCRVVERMKLDPDIILGMGVKLATYQTVKVTLNGRPDIVNFMQEEIRRVWYHAVPQILEALSYSRAGGEVVFKKNDEGKICFSKLRDVYPTDMTILTRDGDFAGIRVSNEGGDFGYAEKADRKKTGRTTLLSPKGLLYVHGRRFGSWNGRSELLGAYHTFLEKTSPNGALDIRRLWFYKSAFSGYFITHPPGDYVEQSIGGQPGRRIPYRDLARHLAEAIRTGAVYGVPAEFDPNTKQPLWSIVAPEINGDASGLHEYIKELRGEMLHGLGIPDDVVSMVSDASGFGGRSIPLIAFLTSQQTGVRSMATVLKDQLFDPLAQLNFGSCDYDMQVEVDVDRLMPGQPNAVSDQSKTAGGQGDGVPVPPDEQEQGPPGQQPPGQQQMSADARANAENLFGRGAELVFGKGVSQVRFVVNGVEQSAVDPRFRDYQQTQMSVRHAPKGGATLKGTFFNGGEFIPDEVPAISEGSMRLTHFTSHDIAMSLLGGSNFRSPKGLSSTTDAFSDNEHVLDLLKTGKTGAFTRSDFGPSVVIIDMPAQEHRIRSNPTSGMGDVPHDRIRGVYNTETKRFIANPNYNPNPSPIEIPAAASPRRGKSSPPEMAASSSGGSGEIF